MQLDTSVKGNLNINRSVATFSGGMAIIGAVIVLFSYFGISLMGGVQTAITAHKDLTEAQQSIVMNMILYARGEAETMQEEYMQARHIVSGQRRAINALRSMPSEEQVVVDGFAHGELSRSDIREMSRMFLYLRNYEPFRQTIHIWRESNNTILELQQAFAIIKERKKRGTLSDAGIEHFLKRLTKSEKKLAALDEKLTYQLGHISDWLKSKVQWASILIGLFLTGMGGFFTLHLRQSIAEWKKEMESSRQRYLSLFENSSMPIFSFDTEGRFTSLNPRGSNLFMPNPEYLIGCKVTDFFDDKDRVVLERCIRETLMGKHPGFQGSITGRKGDRRDLNVVFTPIVIEGKIKGAFGVARDVTEFNRAQHEKEVNHARFRQLFDNAPFGICLLDADRRVERVNNPFLERFGYRREEVKGRYLEDLIIGPGQNKEAEVVRDSIINGHNVKIETIRYHREGKPVNVILGAVPVRLNDRNIGFYGIYVDITQREEAKRRLKSMLQEKKVMIQEIHHRVKNNLAVISGLLELQLMYVAENEVSYPLKKSLERVHSMAAIHELLYQAEDFSQLSFEKYLQHVPELYGSGRKDPSITIDSQPVMLNVNQAIPFALLLNELVAKVYSRRVREQEGAKLEISLREVEGVVTLRLRHSATFTGKDGLQHREADKISSLLLETLQQQLDADLKIRENGRSQISLSFKKQNLSGSHSNLS